MKKFLLAIAISVALAGCASVGKEFSTTDVSSIQKGKTTKTELIQRFGEPSSQVSDSEGNTTYVWTYAKAVGFTPATGKSLSVTVDNGGVVKNYALAQTKY